MLSKSSRQKGFTLIEASIALVVVGLLIMGGVKLMTSSSDVSRYKSTEQQLLEIQQGLTSYYTQFRRLPCPDTDLSGSGLGIENTETSDGSCSNLRGFLPHVTLGLGGNGDAWDERFKYVVSPKFTVVTPPNTIPAICYSTTMREATGKVSIYDLTIPLPTAGPNITDFAAFAVLSTGKNGPQTNAGMTGAFTNNGGCTSVNERERENCNDDSVLRTGTAMTDGNSVIFDDMLVWIGDMQLVSLLRQTGACDVENTESSSFDPSKPTDTDFTTGAYNISGDFDGRDKIPDDKNKVIINGDVKKDLDMKGGDNILLVKGNMSNDFSENILVTGSGNDIIRFEGGVYESISTGSGNDQLEVQGSVNLSSSITNDTINMGSGNDQIRIYGNVSNSRILLGSGENTIYVGGTISSGVRITAEDGTGILYYNSSTKPSSSALTLGSTVTIKCRINNAWTDCP